MDSIIEIKQSYKIYIDKETRKLMKIKEAITGIKYQNKIRNFIMEDLKNEKDNKESE